MIFLIRSYVHHSDGFHVASSFQHSPRSKFTFYRPQVAFYQYIPEYLPVQDSLQEKVKAVANGKSFTIKPESQGRNTHIEQKISEIQHQQYLPFGQEKRNQ